MEAVTFFFIGTLLMAISAFAISVKHAFMFIRHKTCVEDYLHTILNHLGVKSVSNKNIDSDTDIVCDDDAIISKLDILSLSNIKKCITEKPEDVSQLIRTVLEHAISNRYTARQRVAQFMIAIGDDYASKLFPYLRDDEIEVIAFEIARIETLEFIDKNNVICEFNELLIANQFITLGGIDYARSALEKSLGTEKAISILNRMTSSLQVRPFDFIHRCDPRQLLNILQQEHPQTTACVLSYLEPNKASIILQNLSHDIQSDVARRIACLDRVTPENLREVERVIEKRLSSLSSEEYTAAGGVESIVEILNLVDRAVENQIIEDLEDEDPELAEEIKKRMFVFEDIVMMDDKSIQKVFREVDSQELAKALKSVDSEVQDKVFSNMSDRAASMLKEDMEYMGPIRLRDVEEAQNKIVAVIRHLEETGEIIIARAGEDELVV